MNYPIDEKAVKEELSLALSVHVKLLRDVEHIEVDSMDGFTFMMRSFGFIFERIPRLLIEDNIEEAYYGIFQYYNLLAELKKNVRLSFSYAQLQNQSLSVILEAFPTKYEPDINQWWETKTGLKVNHTKQTMSM